jgi:hypothetical protein
VTRLITFRGQHETLQWRAQSVSGFQHPRNAQGADLALTSILPDLCTPLCGSIRLLITVAGDDPPVAFYHILRLKYKRQNKILNLQAFSTKYYQPKLQLPNYQQFFHCRVN